MAGCKLILVEGIPGSGKTTTARQISAWLEQHHHQPALFLEGDWGHPADFESVACLNDSEYDTLRVQFPAQADFLAQECRHENGEWFFSYQKMMHEHPGNTPDALLDALKHYEIYGLPAEKFMRLLLQRWQNFAAKASADEYIYVFECCFLQNPVTTLMAYHALPDETVRQYVLSLASSITALHPKLIYLRQTDVSATLENIRSSRPKDWSDFVIWYLTGQEYGKTHGLHGYEGVIDFYAMRQRFEMGLLPTLPISTTVISDIVPNWKSRYQKLVAFLES